MRAMRPTPSSNNYQHMATLVLAILHPFPPADHSEAVLEIILFLSVLSPKRYGPLISLTNLDNANIATHPSPRKPLF